MRSDLVQAAVWVAAGAAILYASWTMDRLERYGATFYTAPALVPGLLGLVLLALGLLLGARAIRQGALRPAPALAWSWGNTPVVLVLCLGYAVGLVGRAPYWLATFVFVTAFITVFEYPVRRRMALAPVYGALTSLAVTYLFESVFLVRLP
ncbi:MAG: tripartite tricarboxylate transporter TctB family protein [Burkholderiales bacterium]